MNDLPTVGCTVVEYITEAAPTVARHGFDPWAMLVVVVLGVISWLCFGLLMRALSNQRLLQDHDDWCSWRSFMLFVSAVPLLNVAMTLVEWTQYGGGAPAWTWRGLKQNQPQSWLR